MTQKLFFSVLGLLSFMFVSTSAFAQNSAGVEDVTGVYQLMGGKKELKGKDVGDKKNANNAMFVVLFDDGTAYSFFAKSLAEVNKAKVNALISSGTAVKGEYSFDGDAITMQFTGQERGTINYDRARKSFIYDYNSDTRIMFKKILK